MTDIFDRQKNNMHLYSEIMSDINVSMNNRFLEKLSPIVSDIIERIEKEEDEKEKRLKGYI